jgi:hypothetical protein
MLLVRLHVGHLSDAQRAHRWRRRIRRRAIGWAQCGNRRGTLSRLAVANSQHTAARQRQIAADGAVHQLVQRARRLCRLAQS